MGLNHLISRVSFIYVYLTDFSLVYQGGLILSFNKLTWRGQQHQKHDSCSWSLFPTFYFSNIEILAVSTTNLKAWQLTWNRYKFPGRRAVYYFPVNKPLFHLWSQNSKVSKREIIFWFSLFAFEILRIGWLIYKIITMSVKMPSGYDSVGSCPASWAPRNIYGHTFIVYSILYNKPSYSHILIDFRLWSIRRQTHEWRHHHKVFSFCILKWRNVKLKIIS